MVLQKWPNDLNFFWGKSPKGLSYRIFWHLWALRWTQCFYQKGKEMCLKNCLGLLRDVLQHFQDSSQVFLVPPSRPPLPPCLFYSYRLVLLNACIALLCRRFFCWVCKKEESDYISTRSTLTPQGSVASSNEFCMTWLIVSRSDRISAKFLVPNTFRRVVAASSRVEWLQSKTEKSMKYCWGGDFSSPS